ncbi:MAG: hypothetical protein ABS44_10315 [Chryseobacterium sp. SCN 40-13]|nr:MAG: hypothetical protein ABS44_10315 [Chryseobacterium sp. SCN 40-13]
MKIRKGLIPMIAAGLLLASCEKKVVVQDQTGNETAVSDAPNTTISNNETVQREDLPEPVKSFVDKHYAGTGVAHYELKTIPAMGDRYEVKMNNGAEIDFDKDGNWEEIKDGQGVPDALVPQNILSYVQQNYQGIKIKSIDKDNNKIKVDLLNDIDLEFDSNGTFIRIDK